MMRPGQLLTPFVGRVPLGLARRIAVSAGALSRRFGRGGGTTLPGLVLLRLRPDAIIELSRGLKHGCVLISATNGKTTTTRLVVAAAQALGLNVVTNAEGSNLERGIATALANPETKSADIAIFEVDEAALPAVARATGPRALVLMNLFRDQLDRYGELDTLVDSWRDLLGDESAARSDRDGQNDRDGQGGRDGCTLVVNSDDPNLASLADARTGESKWTGPVIWFGIDDRSQALAQRAHAADATTCRHCGHPLEHDLVLLGHLGHWRCTNCNAARPEPSVRATATKLRTDGQTATIEIDRSPVTVESPLAGLHNTYNLTAALAATQILPGIHGNRARVAAALGETGPAFGRGERVTVDGRRLNLLLAKNPTGVNQNIRTVLDSNDTKECPHSSDTCDRVHMLALLNDRTADGQDVSWIWDVDWEPLNGRLASLTLAGERAYDLALRFKYGGFDTDAITVETDPGRALDTAISATPAGATLHALGTYTAMLDLRGELTKRGVVDAYWQNP